jgi:hypothetical protein
MDKFTNFISTVKDADVWQQEAATGTSDKLVKCFAVIGLLATAKTVWSPLKRYLTGEKVTAAEVSQLLLLQARIDDKDEDGRRNLLRVELILNSRVLLDELGGKVRL